MANDIIGALTSGITGLVQKIPEALKSGFSALIYENPEATDKVLSGFAQFGLIFAGISLGAGLVYSVIRMIRSRG